MSARALQEKRLEAGKVALERLRSDAKRRRHHDAWEAVIGEFDGAVRASPGGGRAAEAALWGARAREDLWSVSRSRRDAAAAVEAYRKVDESYTGSAQAPRALLSAARLGLPVAEYAPLRIKSSVVGYGLAQKEQVQFMVARLLGLAERPEPADAADALAIAICHIHTAQTLMLQAGSLQGAGR